HFPSDSGLVRLDRIPKLHGLVLEQYRRELPHRVVARVGVVKAVYAWVKMRLPPCRRRKVEIVSHHFLNRSRPHDASLVQDDAGATDSHGGCPVVRHENAGHTSPYDVSDSRPAFRLEML